MSEFEKEVIERLTKIETSLEYHIKRTDDLESLFKRTEQRYWLLTGALVLAVTGLKLL